MTAALFAPGCYCYRTWNLCDACKGWNAAAALKSLDPRADDYLAVAREVAETVATVGSITGRRLG